jgi:radical SAM protein with 4Fe4S-binding SPASM domain
LSLDAMLGNLRNRIVIGASTNRAVAVPIGMAFGLWGMLRRRRGSLDHLKSTISLASRQTSVAGRPMNITIEPTNACNLGCPVCETGAGVLGRETGHMSLDDFKTIIDKVGSHTNTLMFYFMGEPFLNKQAYEMIRYAKDAGIPFIDTCTNGDFVDPIRTVQCGLDRVSFQIGGMTQETHEVYRVNGRLDRVLERLEQTICERNARGSSLRIEAGLILMKHNEHEVEEFHRRMSGYGVDRAIVIDPCVRTIEQGLQFLPNDRTHWLYDEGAFNRGILRPKVLPDNICPWIYYSLAILVNGDVVPCCRDPRGTEIMGNMLGQDFDDIWNGAPYRQFRERIERDQGSVGICRLCSAYPVSRVH